MNILAISPHADDSEFGVGGTLHKLVSEGHNVTVLIFYDNEELKREAINSMKIIGAKTAFEKMEGRRYHRDRQLILDYLCGYDQVLSPDIVFVPSRHDIHQDHQVITNEAIRAFRTSTILGYNQPWKQTTVINNYIVPLESINIDMKIAAIKQYHSRSFKPYFSLKYQLGLMIQCGIKINKKYAEGFEVIHIIGGKVI